MIRQILIPGLGVTPLINNHVYRPQLMSQLREGQSHKLTLLRAPAGFGKTTLLREWAHESEIAVVWLSLDIHHNIPSHFFDALESACQPSFNGLLEVSPNRNCSDKWNSAQIAVATVIDQLCALRKPLGIVMDNFQVIENEVTLECVAHLLKHLPPQVSLYIASRCEPPLPLARLRARNRMTELGAKDLRFTYSESLEFLSRTNVSDLSEDDVISLYARTEGWIEGLCIAANLMSESNPEQCSAFIAEFAGHNHYMADYMLEEVLSQHSEAVQTYLLQTSILKRLNGPLCQAVTGQADSLERIEQIERGGVFIEPVDPFRNWYRYHRLIAQFLNHRLHQLHPGQIVELHRRASEWYEHNHMYSRAVQHALAAHRWEDALRLINRSAETMSSGGLEVTAADRIDDVAVTRYWIHPDGYVSDTSNIGTNFRRTAFGTAQFGIPHTLAAGQASLRNGNVVEAEQILSAVDSTDPRLKDVEAQIALLSTLGEIRLRQGKLHEAAATYESIEHQSAELPLQGHLLNFYHGLYCLHYEWNDLDKALYYVQMYPGEGGQSCPPVPWSIQRHLDVARLSRARKEHQAADESLIAAEKLARTLHDPVYLWRVAAHRARLDLRLDRIDSAGRWSKECGLHHDDEANYANQFEYLTLVRVLIARGDAENTQKLLANLHAAATKDGRDRDIIEIMMLTALARRTQGRQEEAFATLAEAVCLAEQEHYMRTFVDEGAPVAELLRQVEMHGITTLYVRKLLSALEDSPLSATRPPKPIINEKSERSSPLVEPLTPREMEVLQLMATGDSNREIAALLNIAPNTVKKHVSNIIGKLGAKNRLQSVAKARDLHLW